MRPAAPHHPHPVADTPGWSLLRLSAAVRLAAAAGLSALLWLCTLLVIA